MTPWLREYMYGLHTGAIAMALALLAAGALGGCSVDRGGLGFGSSVLVDAGPGGDSGYHRTDGGFDGLDAGEEAGAREDAGGSPEDAAAPILDSGRMGDCDAGPLLRCRDGSTYCAPSCRAGECGEGTRCVIGMGTGARCLPEWCW